MNVSTFILGQVVIKSEIFLYEDFAAIKYCIHIERLNGKELHFTYFVEMMKDKFMLKQKLAKNIENQKMMKFDFNWKHFFSLWSDTNSLNSFLMLC